MLGHLRRSDPQSRAINERAHANIQKDGTYSVIPRMWGGETSADELRRIADAADKYKVPTIKVTGGQRLVLRRRGNAAGRGRLFAPASAGGTGPHGSKVFVFAAMMKSLIVIPRSLRKRMISVISTVIVT